MGRFENEICEKQATRHSIDCKLACYSFYSLDIEILFGIKMQMKSRLHGDSKIDLNLGQILSFEDKYADFYFISFLGQ